MTCHRWASVRTPYPCKDTTFKRPSDDFTNTNSCTCCISSLTAPPCKTAATPGIADDETSRRWLIDSTAPAAPRVRGDPGIQGVHSGRQLMHEFRMPVHQIVRLADVLVEPVESGGFILPHISQILPVALTNAPQMPGRGRWCVDRRARRGWLLIAFSSLQLPKSILHRTCVAVEPPTRRGERPQPDGRGFSRKWLA